MTHRPRFYLIVGTILLLSAVSRAECPPLLVFVGGTPMPMTTRTNIRMDSEEVTIRLKRNGYTIRAFFRFFNTGETTTDWVAFPKRVMKYRSNVCPDPSQLVVDFSRFDAWIDGKKAKFSERRHLVQDSKRISLHRSEFGARTTPGWIVGRVTFPGYSTTTMCVSYDSTYVGYSNVYYICGTGRHWKGTIGKAAFNIDSLCVGGAKNIRVQCSAILCSRRILESVDRYEVRNVEPSSQAVLQVKITDLD